MQVYNVMLEYTSPRILNCANLIHLTCKNQAQGIKKPL